MVFDVQYKMFISMCSIALFEYSRNHEKDEPQLAQYARFLSDNLDALIEKLTKEE